MKVVLIYRPWGGNGGGLVGDGVLGRVLSRGVVVDVRGM